jgi:hypothetical protein
MRPVAAISLLGALASGGCYDFSLLGRSPCQDQDPNIVCIDFESGLPTNAWQINATDNSRVELDTTRAHAGHTSLHAHLDAPTDPTVTLWQAQLVSLKPTPPTPDLYIRAWVFVPAPAPQADVRLISEAEPVQGVLPNVGLVDHRGLLGVADQVTDPTVSRVKVSDTVLPTDSWHCLVLHVTTSEPSHIDGFLDGVAPAKLVNGAPTQLSPPLSRVSLGLRSPPLGPFDAWYDDVVIDSKQPGCGP